MSDLWKEFVSHLAAMDGVERRDVRLIEGLLHAAANEYRRRARGSDDTDASSGGLSPLRAETIHKDLIEACATVLSAAPSAARAVKAALRASVQALVSRSNNSDNDNSHEQQRPEPFLSSLVALPAPDIGVLLTVGPLEPNIEPLVQAVGPYVRHPEGKRALAGSGGVLQHLATADVVQRYLRWSDQRVENVHSGVGSMLASVQYVHRRKLVFVISAEHAKPWSDADEGRGASTRFPWKLMKETSSTTAVLREPHAPSRAEDPMAQEAEEEDGFRSARYTPVHVTEVQSIRVAAGLDHHGAMQLLSVVRGNLIQWEKQSQNELEKRLKRMHEAQLSQQQHRQQDEAERSAKDSMNILPNEPSPPSAGAASAVTPERLAPSAHFMQVVILVDTENHHVGEQLMSTLRTTVLPKLQQTRLAARASRAKQSMKVVFDLFPQVILFGKRVLPLVLPPALEAAAAGAPRSMAADGEGPCGGNSTSVAERVATVAAHVQSCIKEYPTMVSLAIPSDALLPPSLEADLLHHVWNSEVVVSFHRLSSSRVDGLSGSRSVSLQLHYPGGERMLPKQALQLYFQLWCVDVAAPSFKAVAEHRTVGAPSANTTNSGGGGANGADAVQSHDGVVPKATTSTAALRRPLMEQYDAFVVSHREVLQRVCVICRIVTDNDDGGAAGRDGGSREEDAEAFGVQSEGSNVALTTRSAKEEEAVLQIAASTKTHSSPFVTPPMLRITYADVLNVVLRSSLVYPPPPVSQTDGDGSDKRCVASSRLLPSTPTCIARRLVGHSTALTLLASLFASYGINTVVYEDNEPNHNSVDRDEEEHQPHVVPILLGFSLMQDVSGYGKEFVDDCWYAPLQRQLSYLRHCFWPLLVALRHRAVIDIRRASVQSAKRLHVATASRGTAGSHVMMAGAKQPRAPSRFKGTAADVNNLRQVFVVAVSEDEDAETLERADKRGELGNALSMPIFRVFLLPTPFLLAAQQGTPCRRRSAMSDVASDAASSVSPAPSVAHRHDPRRATVGGGGGGHRQPTTDDEATMVDDAPFLFPHVYQPEDADALSRVAHEFAERLEDRRFDTLRQPSQDSDGAKDAPSSGRVAKVLMDSINLRVCSAAVLDVGRLADHVSASSDKTNNLSGRGGVGPLLPCVEVSLDYNSGPHVEADDSLFLGGRCGDGSPTSNAAWLLNALRAPAGPPHESGASVLGTVLSDWVLSTANDTMEDSKDVARVKEEALVHAIRAAESMLTGEDHSTSGAAAGSSAETGKGRDAAGTADLTSSDDDDERVSEDADETPDRDDRDGSLAPNNNTTTAGAGSEETQSSWWWWWGSSSTPAATPDVTGLRFSLQSTKLERKRVPQ